VLSSPPLWEALIAEATTPGTSSNFQLVGHEPLFNRGMNAALAIFDHFVYIGNRTDGSDTCAVTLTSGCPHVHPGVQIVECCRSYGLPTSRSLGIGAVPGDDHELMPNPPLSASRVGGYLLRDTVPRGEGAAGSSLPD
jgi:hypothetical protein